MAVLGRQGLGGDGQAFNLSAYRGALHVIGITTARKRNAVQVADVPTRAAFNNAVTRQDTRNSPSLDPNGDVGVADYVAHLISPRLCRVAPQKSPPNSTVGGEPGCPD